MSLLLNGAGDLVTGDMEKDKIFNAFFASDFTVKNCLQESQISETTGKVWSKEDLSLGQEDLVREHLNRLDIHKSMGPQVLRQLADVTVRQLSTVFERL